MTAPATITIPADYLEYARSAIIAEVGSDSDALRTAEAADRNSTAVYLQRDMPLLDQLLNASGEIGLTAEQDNISSPLVHMLEALVRLLLERLGDAAEYGPMPMADILDLTAGLRWAAEQALRIDDQRYPQEG